MSCVAKKRDTLYSVSFQYLRKGVWCWTLDHRVWASDVESAIRRWRGAGYGETRNFHVKELEKRS